MTTYFNHLFHRVTLSTAMLLGACTLTARAQSDDINRYVTDFWYHGIGYQILSETDRTVAVTQEYDIDSAGPEEAPLKSSGLQKVSVGPNGFMMSSVGLFGPATVIPSTVYDEEGTPYTVTDLATGAINWVSTMVLVLPNTLERLNSGIVTVTMSELYLPEGLKELTGIINCENLKTLHIPASVEIIGDRALRSCGLETIYLPPSVKRMDDNVLSECENLTTTVLSELESMGSGCFQDATSMVWANLPQTLREMGEGCFNNCPSIELISLPWRDIKMNACFNGCPAVRRIEVLAMEPNPFPNGSLIDVDRSTCELAVPKGCAEKYRQAEGWKDFLNIVEDLPAITPAESAAIPMPDFRAFGGKGFLRVISASNLPIEVYSIDGEKAASTAKAGSTDFTLPTGIYVVSSPYGSRKVAVN